MSKRKREAPERFINRELSWLEFNDRVLREGLSSEVPLAERLKFLAIVSSNLDENFMIRVAGLMQQRAAGVRRRDASGMTPTEQLKAYSRRAHRMLSEQYEGIGNAFREMERHGLCILEAKAWNPKQREFLHSYFHRNILPVLTPLSVLQLDPFPLLPGLQLHIAAMLEKQPDDDETKDNLVVMPVPGGLPRFITLPSEHGTCLACLEEVIAKHLGVLFPTTKVLATTVFRLTRDADVTIDDDDVGDLLSAVEEAVIARRRRMVVRMQIAAGAEEHLKNWLVEWFKLSEEEVYEIPGILDATALFELAGRPELEKVANPEWAPQPPRDLLGKENPWEALQDEDVLLFHPYESFDPVIQLMEQAAGDPGVLAIKQCLYRTSGDSPIIRALERAAQNGKEVTVLVELKARFDEARNVGWARRLENAGCHVIYGIAGYKTHAKALLIVRREEDRIRRYVHLATGNYNDKTARLYSDIGLMTTSQELARDVAAFFNLLTGRSEMVGWSKLAIAPTGLRPRFLDLIDREIQASTPTDPGLIMAKVNSLEDPVICEALYRASQAGVTIKLNVRGICCLRPGMEGFSENIEVRSIVDRYLEHARIFYFQNAGHGEIYLSSADWMVRNLTKRLELLFPVEAPAQAKRLLRILETFFEDNLKAHRLLPDGTYERVVAKGAPVRAQERFHDEAVEATRLAERTNVQFRPLAAP